MKKRGLWIFDENYLMLTYLSMSSFIEHCDVIPTLIFCGKEMKETDRRIFLSLDSKVEIYHFNVDVSHWEPHMQANILNRLARLHYTRLFENDLLFLIDSDVAFSSSLKDDFKEIEALYLHDSETLPMIAGVVEFLRASDAFLYFRKKDEHDYIRKTTEEAMLSSYLAIYGSEWKQVLSGFQLNNGFLIFYKARTLIDQWEEYYLEGLSNPDINPLDDQVPLAAAIHKIGCKYWKMDSKWNSLGDISGQYTMLHAWGGGWKSEIDQVLRNGKATADFGKICQQYLHNCPKNWIDKFDKDLNSVPFRYRQIQGIVDHGTVFSDLISQLDEGHIVEVGTYKGRSACFVAELIKSSNKNITFDTIDHFERSDTDLETVNNSLSHADVESYVNVIESDSLKATELYNSNQLDFVFLDINSHPDTLKVELEAWFGKVKEGGILAGYDYSIHDTIYKNYNCTTSSFCERHKIPLRTYEYQFVIKKPFKTI